MIGPDKGCAGCKYYRRASEGMGWWACLFMYDTGERRGCPPGEGCTRRDETKAEPPKTFTLFRK